MVHIQDAKREAVPMLIALAAPSGGGKTYSALLLAAGLVTPGQKKVGFIDTDNRRGQMYQDSPEILEAMPQGYRIAYMSPPFSPKRFIEYAKAFAADGCEVLIIDTITEEYEGTGGLEEMAEVSKTAWLTPKREHKRMMNELKSMNMDIIFCVRAREKVKVDKKTKDYVDLGIQPVCEKNFMFDMILSMMLDVETNLPRLTKCPAPLRPLFSGKQGKITKATGEALRAWAQSGRALDPELEAALKEAREIAEGGRTKLRDYYSKLPAKTQTVLKAYHTELSGIADAADEFKKMEAENTNPTTAAGNTSDMFRPPENRNE